jgi:hypothetical protein
MASEHDPHGQAEGLPLSQRFLLATVLPWVVPSVAGYMWISQVGPRVLERVANQAGLEVGMAVAAVVSFVPIFVSAPLAVALVGGACLVPWTTRRRALAGGLLRVASAVACGMVVVVALKVLSSKAELVIRHREGVKRMGGISLSEPRAVERNSFRRIVNHVATSL